MMLAFYASIGLFINAIRRRLILFCSMQHDSLEFFARHSQILIKWIRVDLGMRIAAFRAFALYCRKVKESRETI
jgi:hypothetical protein